MYKHKKRTVTVSKLTEGLALVAARIRIPEDIDASEKQAATTTKVLTRTSAYYEEILKEKKVPVLPYFNASFLQVIFGDS
jgi:hypothetical protein